MWRDPAPRQKDWSESGPCPGLWFRGGLPGGLKKQSRTPAAGRLDRNTVGDTGTQRGDVTTGMIKSSNWNQGRSRSQVHTKGK